MAENIHIYYEPELESEANQIGQGIEEWMGLAVVKGPVALPKESYDSLLGFYDVEYLLEFLGEIMRRGYGPVAVWLISKRIGCIQRPVLFGAACERQAVVSAWDIGRNPDLLIKEVYHELGHLYGLSHCTNHCAMAVSHNQKDLERKKRDYCSECRKIIQEKACCKEEL